LIEAFNAKAKKPSAANVQTLCRFYVKRPWGKQYAFTHSDSSHMRPFYEHQLALIRDTLQRGGKAALPALRAFMKEDEPLLARALAKLKTDEEHWSQQRARLRGLPLARIAREREDIQAIRVELKDLADLIDCATRDRLSGEQISRLCRICTQRGWPGQNQLIGELLKRSGAIAAPIIREHIKREKQALGEIRSVIELAMPKVSSTPTRWRYERAVALDKNIRKGIKELQSIVRGAR
jgi:hypothetical protein